MPRKATKPVEPDPELEIEPAPPRQARVIERHSSTRTYLEEEAAEPTDAEPVEVSRIEAFLRSLASDRKLSLFAHYLPNYERDGITSTRALGRTWLTRFEFTPEMVDGYQERIQQLCSHILPPSGGWVDFELRENGQPITGGRWQEKIGGLPLASGAVQPQQTQPGYPVIIQQPGVTPVDPMAQIKAQLGLTKDLVGLARDLIPPAPEPAAQNGAAGSEKPFGEKLFETVALAAISNPAQSGGLKDVLGMISENREPPWYESLFSSPVLTELIKGVVPGINTWITTRAQINMAQARREMAMADREAGLVPGAAPAPGQIAGGSTASSAGPSVGVDLDGGGSASTTPEASTPHPPAMSRAERLWRRTFANLIDDIAEDVSVRASAERIVDLLTDQLGDSEEEQLVKAFIATMLEAKPEEVIEAGASLAQTQEAYENVMGLKKSQANLKWVSDLQATTKQILSEEQNANTEGADG